jgi:3-(3-hydroxy-phenyl)propionate hydroxylase
VVGQPQSHVATRRACVVIVGAGPTGLVAANLLGKAGVDTLLIERRAALHDFPRAISLDDEGLRICQELGLSSSLRTLDIYAHYVSRGRLLATVAPTGRPNGYQLIATFYQPELEAALLQGLGRFACVQVLFQHTFESLEQDELGVRLTVRTSADELLCVECAYLLACDGGKSAVRSALGIAMRPPQWRAMRGDQVQRSPLAPAGSARGSGGTRWLVVDCVDDDDPSPVAIFFCDPARPAVTVPSPHNRRRWEFMLMPGEREADLLRPETIHALIGQARASLNPATGLAPPRIMRRAVYTFHTLLATRFASGRVFLLGDAAHLMPPFGGQGMNSGMRDAHNLCWKLHMVLQGRADARLLETYQQERAPHVAQMILFSSLLGRLIMPTSRPIAFGRDLLFRGVINTIPSLRSAIKQLRVRPPSIYTRGFLLPIRSRADQRLRGVMLPQPHVIMQEGRRVLLDEVLGDGFALLTLSHDPPTLLMEDDDLYKRLNLRIVHVQPAEASITPVAVQEADDPRCISVLDSEGTLSAFLRHDQNAAILVRPDRYIMGVLRAGDTTYVRAHLLLS